MVVLSTIYIPMLAIYYNLWHEILMEQRKLWQFVIRNFGEVLLVRFLYISHETLTLVWMVKFDKPPVMCQTHQGFLPPKIHSTHGKWCVFHWVMLTKIAKVNTPTVMLIWYMVKTMQE